MQSEYSISNWFGGEAGILNSNGNKPKAMNWRTFKTLHATQDAHVEQAMAGMWAKMGLAINRFRCIKT